MSGTDYEMEGYCPFCNKESIMKHHSENHERDSSGDYRVCSECGARKSEVFSFWHKDGEWIKDE